jgi:hypothetical protein
VAYPFLVRRCYALTDDENNPHPHFSTIGDLMSGHRFAQRIQESRSKHKTNRKACSRRFPTGVESPEGAACDFARAFINRDSKLFRATCLPPYLGGEARKAYEKFLADTTASMDTEAKKPEPSAEGPKTLAKVFTARHLSMNGPASYAYAVLNCQDVMFVDVGCFLHNGDRFLNRTLVVKTSKGDWRVHPMPQNDTLLSAGLNDEKPSTEDFSEQYDVPKR